VIRVKESKKAQTIIKQLFDAEPPLDNDRATTTITQKDTLVFTIKAKDGVALRATANTILKTLAVYDGVAKKNG